MTELKPDRDEWLKWRSEGITATDVADAHAGSYGGAYGVIARKLGVVTVETNDQMQRGHDWQPVIADAVHTLTGSYVVGEETWCEHPDDPRWRATVDGFLAPKPEATPDDLEAVLEVKTVGARVRPNRSRWHTQVQWQMFVTGMRRALLAEARIDDAEGRCDGLRLEWVDADLDMQNELVGVASRLYGFAVVGVLPEPDSPSALELVKGFHATADASLDDADLSGLAEDVARFAEIKAAVKAVEDERDLLEARIRDAVGDATRGVCDGWRVSVSAPSKVLTADAEVELLAAHPEFARPALDRKRVKAEAPELYDAFTAPVGARRLTIKESK